MQDRKDRPLDTHGGAEAPADSVLNTVEVPEAVRDIFLKAQTYVGRYFREMVRDPQRSTVAISGERYILVRAASMSVQFFDLVMSLYRDRGEQEARSVAANLLFDVAHSIGKADARAFHARLGVSDPIDRLSAGPVHFAHAGWAFVHILPESSPSPDDNFFLIYDHPFSFESDSWLKQGRKTTFPVCAMNAGYSSGWCAESFGVDLVAVEISCLARGDRRCRFIMAPPSRIEQHLKRYVPGWTADAPNPGQGLAVPEFFQRKRLEEDLRRSYEEMEQRVVERTAELERANAALKLEIAERVRAEQERASLQAQVLHSQKLESMGVMAGGIAHDFNNLLAVILGNASMAQMDVPAGSAASESIRNIEKAAQNAANLTHQILAYSGRGEFLVEPLNLSALVEQMTALLRTLAGRRAHFEMKLDPDLPPIEADAAQIQQVVINLLTNAAEAIGDAEGLITISTGLVDADAGFFSNLYLNEPLKPGHYISLRVTDTGCGMDDLTRQRLFDPFFSTKFTGRGLGLAAVLGIVRGHQGGIQVTSTPGSGSTFEIVFPVSTKPLAARPPVAEASGRWRGYGRVLVVDDDEPVRETAQGLLESLGFTTEGAADGRQALELFKTRKDGFVLVMLDLTMPGMSGEETFRALREANPAVPVLISSGYSEQDALKRFGGAAQAYGFVQKPYTPAQLAAKIRALLEPGGSR